VGKLREHFIADRKMIADSRFAAGFGESFIVGLDLNQRLDSLAENRGWFLEKWELIGALSPLVRYGGNSGDSIHVETRFRTPCHYQIFF
jgi:hypothetical protein